MSTTRTLGCAMIRDLWLIGIGTGSPAHVTLEGQKAIREAAVILMPVKGEDKDGLAQVRREIIEATGSGALVIDFQYPTRDPSLPYQDRVAAWHDEIARRWQQVLPQNPPDDPVALLVWGDPSLYDSTIRIAERLTPAPTIRVVPGITAIQALTAAHRIPLNTIDGSIHVVTGRTLRQQGLANADASTIVMLDGECSFQSLNAPETLNIWWGAYLGSDDEILVSGNLREVGAKIVEARAKARQRHGWIMDTYLIRHI